METEAENMAFAGVESSAKGRRWTGPGPGDERLAERISQATDLPLPLCMVLARRGVEPEGAELFLNPTMTGLMPDPSGLRDMDKAVERFARAVEGRERIAVLSDYDVDGTCSATLIKTWLAGQGMDMTLHIPDRIAEGYGPNPKAMRDLAEEHSLILCLDCGTQSHEAIAAAEGADVIIIDHHVGAETLPDALAVINPNRQDEDSPLEALCAAGVVFMFLVAANRLLRNQGKSVQGLTGLLDLVALATVADSSRLEGLNRAFVKKGLEIMTSAPRPAIRAMSKMVRLDLPPATFNLGYQFAPRINAAGRVGDAGLSVRLLGAETDHEAEACLERIEAFNLERREREAKVLREASMQIEERGAQGPIVWAWGERWHPGVVGIVASRLQDLHGKPAVVIGFNEDEGKGSGRSIAGINLGSAVFKCVSEGLLVKGGGHQMAVGLTVRRERLRELMRRMEELVERQSPIPEKRDLHVAGLLYPKAATPQLLEDLERAGPYGMGAPEPVFVFESHKVTFARRVGETSLAVTLKGACGTSLGAFAFRAFETPLGETLERNLHSPMHIAGRLERNRWRPDRVQIQIVDAALPS